MERIVSDNESAVRAALDRGDYVQAFLLLHSLIESLLRALLDRTDSDVKFTHLIDGYSEFLCRESPGIATFVHDLKEFNRRRNRIVHELWKKGYTYTNEQAKDAADAAVSMYGLFIEFLQTYNPQLADKGFQYDSGDGA